MDEAERAFIESLIQTHRGHLQVLEQQSATFGIMAPPYIVTQIAEYRQKIAELEDKLRQSTTQQKDAPRHNLPPRDYERFVGRQKELSEVRRLLGPKSRAFVVTVDGIGGIGKSTLVLEAAYTFVDQYNDLPATERFDAIVWVSAKRTYLTASGIRERRQVFRTLSDVFAAIARVLDYPAITRARVEEQREIVEQVLREQRTLLILDNLETVDDDELTDFLHELPEPTKALVTTRHRIDVARPVRLKDMAREDALELIRQEASQKDVVIAPAQQEALWERAGGVPLAIVWSVGLMGLGGSVESVLRRLHSGQSDIARFCFDESMAQIQSHDSHKLLMALALFAVDASRETLGIVAGLGDNESRRDEGLQELLRLSLVNKEGDRFSLLPLTRSYVQDEAARRNDWTQAARERLYARIDDLTNEQGGWSKDWEGHALIERELHNILPTIDELVAGLEYEQNEDLSMVLKPASVAHARRVCKIMPRVARTCRIRGYWTISENLSNTTIKISRELGERQFIGHRYWDLSKISYLRADLETTEDLLNKAINEWQPFDRGTMKCRAISVLGLIALHRGDMDQGSSLIRQALADYQALQAEYALSDFIGNVGYLDEKRGDLEAARAHYNQAMELARQSNDLPRLAADTISLGRVTLVDGDIDAAESYFLDGLRIAQECGRADVIALAHYYQSCVSFRRGRREQAATLAREALDRFRRLGMKREQAEAEALLAKLTEVIQQNEAQSI